MALLSSFYEMKRGIIINRKSCYLQVYLYQAQINVRVLTHKTQLKRLIAHLSLIFFDFDF